jgi:hypothetical protein
MHIPINRPTHGRREEDILADFEGDDGDRRNELVFIGVGLFEKESQVRVSMCVGVGRVCIYIYANFYEGWGVRSTQPDPCPCLYLSAQRVLHSRLDACLLMDAEMAVYREKAQLGEGSVRALFDAFPNRMEIDMSPQGPGP